MKKTQNEKIQEEKPEEKDVEENSDDKKAKEAMQKELIALTKKYNFVRVTLKAGNQFIYQSKHLQLKAGLFDWGIEGKEIITDDILFIVHDDILKIEGLETPFATEEFKCDFSDEEIGPQVAEILLMSICTYKPIQINYHDKNGRTTLKNLYYTSFLPSESKFSLPYKNLFKNMLNDELDSDHIAAMSPHQTEPRTFTINQIQTIRVFDAFFTTENGIDILKEGISIAEEAEQNDLAEILKSCIE